MTALLRSTVQVPPRLAKADAVRLVERRKELGQRHAEAACETVDDVHGGRLLAPLQIGQVRRVQAGAARQFLLREASPCPNCLDSGAERAAQVVHAGIVPSARLLPP